MAEEPEDPQRWTAKRKAAVVLEVLKNQVTGVEACRKYGIKQSDLEEWTESFLEGGENRLRSNPRDEREAKRLAALMMVRKYDLVRYEKPEAPKVSG